MEKTTARKSFQNTADVMCKVLVVLDLKQVIMLCCHTLRNHKHSWSEHKHQTGKPEKKTKAHLVISIHM